MTMDYNDPRSGRYAAAPSPFYGPGGMPSGRPGIDDDPYQLTPYQKSIEPTLDPFAPPGSLETIGDLHNDIVGLMVAMSGKTNNRVMTEEQAHAVINKIFEANRAAIENRIRGFSEDYASMAGFAAEVMIKKEFYNQLAIQYTIEHLKKENVQGSNFFLEEKEWAPFELLQLKDYVKKLAGAQFNAVNQEWHQALDAMNLPDNERAQINNNAPTLLDTLKDLEIEAQADGTSRPIYQSIIGQYEPLKQPDLNTMYNWLKDNDKMPPGATPLQIKALAEKLLKEGMAVWMNENSGTGTVQTQFSDFLENSIVPARVEGTGIEKRTFPSELPEWADDIVIQYVADNELQAQPDTPYSTQYTPGLVPHYVIDPSSPTGWTTIMITKAQRDNLLDQDAAAALAKEKAEADIEKEKEERRKKRATIESAPARSRIELALADKFFFQDMDTQGKEEYLDWATKAIVAEYQKVVGRELAQGTDQLDTTTLEQFIAQGTYLPEGVPKGVTITSEGIVIDAATGEEQPLAFGAPVDYEAIDARKRREETPGILQDLAGDDLAFERYLTQRVDPTTAAGQKLLEKFKAQQQETEDFYLKSTEKALSQPFQTFDPQIGEEGYTPPVKTQQEIDAERSRMYKAVGAHAKTVQQTWAEFLRGEVPEEQKQYKAYQDKAYAMAKERQTKLAQEQSLKRTTKTVAMKPGAFTNKGLLGVKV